MVGELDNMFPNWCSIILDISIFSSLNLSFLCNSSITTLSLAYIYIYIEVIERLREVRHVWLPLGVGELLPNLVKEKNNLLRERRH